MNDSITAAEKEEIREKHFARVAQRLKKIGVVLLVLAVCHLFLVVMFQQNSIQKLRAYESMSVDADTVIWNRLPPERAVIFLESQGFSVSMETTDDGTIVVAHKNYDPFLSINYIARLQITFEEEVPVRSICEIYPPLEFGTTSSMRVHGFLPP